MHDAAAAIARAMTDCADETLTLYSNAAERAETGPGLWIAEPQQHYFGHKFHTLLHRMNREHALLLVQADATSDNWPRLVRRYRQLLRADPPPGLWAPGIDHTAFPNCFALDGPKSDGLLPVLQTDAVVLGLHPAVLCRLRQLDYAGNNLGWGIDWAAIAYCRLHGLRILRDLTESVHHPPGRGYDEHSAQEQMRAFLGQLTPDEAAALNTARAAITSNINQRHGATHSLTKDLGQMLKHRNSADSALAPPPGLFETLALLVVQPGRVILSPRDPRTRFALLHDGRHLPARACPDPDGMPEVLEFDLTQGSEGLVQLVTGDTWSCPGQSTARYVFPAGSGPMRAAMIAPRTLDAALGAVRLSLNAAVHRADADLLVEWHDIDHPELADELWVKLDKRFTGRLDTGDYQHIELPIPETGGRRRLRITLCFWSHLSDPGEPGVVLCSRPCLLGSHLAGDGSLVMITDDQPIDPARALEIPLAPGTGEIRLLVDGHDFLLLPGAEASDASLQREGAALRATATRPTRASLYVNGNRLQTLDLGSEAAPIALSPEVLDNAASQIELRDLTGNIILARFAPAPSAHPGSEPPARHRDAPLIDPRFDREFYLAGFPKRARPADPASHYLSEGWQQGRDPAPWFSTWHYLAMHADVAEAGMNPFLHYCLSGAKEGRALPRMGQQASGEVYAAQARAVAPGPDFEEFDPTIGIGRKRRAKVLAYYLPQFHPIAVNDRQWGRGFTEWRQLARALPRFAGHIQPRIPRDLGFYDLAEGDAMRRQIEMARAGGIHGFCFYHYWFDGKRVLDRPMERFLADPGLDFPFCLMWANENWTRTWDGSDQQVILAQNYRQEDDIAFIDDIARHMKDPRHIRLDGRPLFFIYRPGNIPEARDTLARWRELFHNRHRLEPLIMMAQGFGDLDPRAYELDGAVEFPPHKLCHNLPAINRELRLLDPDYAGHIISYDAMIERSLAEQPAGFPLIRTVTPSWDNEPRRPGRGMIVQGATPAGFEAWTRRMLSYARDNPVHGEHIICVNAWNEWAEGAVLEPDIHHGGAFLNALSRAVHDLRGATGQSRLRVLIAGHDANCNGAQMLALNIGQVMHRQFGVDIAFILGRDGPMRALYGAIGPTHVAAPQSSEAERVLTQLAAQGFALAITNATPSGGFVPALKQAGFGVVSLIHELPNLLRSYGLAAPARAIAAGADHVVFPAEIVQRGFKGFAGPLAHRGEILPQGLYHHGFLDRAPGDDGLRAELGLAAETRIVLGVGYGDLRKGIDRFVAAGLSLCARHDDIAFLWLGAPAGEATDWFQPEIDASGLGARLRILGHREDVARFFAAANAFYLASREDPFPSVVLEALALGLPVIGHEGCGGCDALIARHGTLVKASDPLAAGNAILKALRKPGSRAAVAARRAEIRQNHDFPDYAFALLQRLEPGLASLSAVVPNYNYQNHIAARLRSIFDQSHPLREVIVLDDASTDESLAEIERTAAAADRQIALHVNTRNSGSPFRQWHRGAELAKGDYLWIAEADDLAEPGFVARLLGRMQATGSLLGFTDSRQIDAHDITLGDSYRPYLDTIEPGAFEQPFDMEGHEFLRRFLAVKNVILNVSGVIVRRRALLDAFAAAGQQLQGYRVAGDWRLYAEICALPGSRICWLPEPLNTHRRHRVSVTHALKAERHLEEIRQMQTSIGERVRLTRRACRLQQHHWEECARMLRDEGSGFL